MFLLYGIVSLLAIACYLFRPIAQANDLWWHLASGRWMAAHQALPRADVFSWTVHGHPWINHEWLSDLIWFSSFRFGGINGILALKIILIGTALLGMGVRLRRAKVQEVLAWTLMAAAFWNGRHGWFERADLFSVALMSLLFVLLDHFKQMTHHRVLLCLSYLLLFGLWANLHGAFLLGLAVLSSAALGMYLDEGHWEGPLLIVVSAFLGVLVNPYGAALPISLLKGMHFLSEGTISEWRSTPWDFKELFWYALPLYWGLLLLKMSRRSSWRYQDLFVGIVLSVAAVKQIRSVPYFGIALFPYFGMGLWRTTFETPLARVLPLLLMGLFIVNQQGHVRGGVDPTQYPVQACDFIEHHALPDRFFNEYAWGGYWIWRFAEKRPVFIDGRLHSVDGYIPLFKDIQNAQGGTPAQWNAFLNQWKVDAALVKKPVIPGVPSPLPAYFPASRWKLTYEDPVAALYTRKAEVLKP